MNGNHFNTASEYETENEVKEDVRYNEEWKSNGSSSQMAGTETSEHHEKETENAAVSDQKVLNQTQQFNLVSKIKDGNENAGISTSTYTESSFDSEGSDDDDFSSGTGISLSSSQRSSDHVAALSTKLFMTNSGIQPVANKHNRIMNDPNIVESDETTKNSQKDDDSVKEGVTTDLIQLGSDSQGSSHKKFPENMSAPFASEESFLKTLQVPGKICNSTPKYDNETQAPISIEQMLFEDFLPYHENPDADQSISLSIADLSQDYHKTGNTSARCKSGSVSTDDLSEMSDVKKLKNRADKLKYHSSPELHDRRKKKKSRKVPTDNDDKYELFKPIKTEIYSPHSKESTSNRSMKLTENTMENNGKRLTEELKAEKRKNKKLSEKIIYLEETLEELRLHRDLEKAEAKMPGHIHSLVEEITKAQKLRESAMINRIKIAVKDRDEALLCTKALYVKIQQLQKKCDGKQSRYQDKTLTELLEKVKSADSARVIERYGKEVVERLEQLKKSRGRIVSEEMNSVMKEKDNAIAKCHKLELDLQNCLDELNRLKQSQDVSFSMSLKAKAIAAQNEKTKAEEKLRNAEEEIQILRIYHSLHKSLAISQDEEMTEKYNQYLASIREEASKRVAQAKQIEAENHQLYEKLRMVTEEKFALQSNYGDVEADNSHLKAKCIKMERLVEVLRKKVIDLTRVQTSRLIPPITDQILVDEVEHE